MGDDNEQTPEEQLNELLKAHNLTNNRKGLRALRKLSKQGKV